MKKTFLTVLALFCFLVLHGQNYTVEWDGCIYDSGKVFYNGMPCIWFQIGIKDKTNNLLEILVLKKLNAGIFNTTWLGIINAAAKERYKLEKPVSMHPEVHAALLQSELS